MIQRKITDVFANFLRGRQEGDEEEHEALLQSQQDQQLDEEGIRASFKGLKWPRVISLQEWETNSARTWDLGADIIFELQQMAEINGAELPELKPAFDPIAFQEDHPDPKIEAHELSQEQLVEAGCEVSTLRMSITLKGHGYEE